MLDKLTYELMQPALDTEFRLREGAAVLILVEVRDLATPATRPRRPEDRSPFSLLFRAPKEFRVPQGILPLECQPFGHLDIFVVPVDEDDLGIYYEAVFN